MNIVNISNQYLNLKNLNEGRERLIRGLLYSSRINSESDELVYILGSGIEKNNEEAVKYWVTNATSDMQRPYTKKHFELLNDMLRLSLDGFNY